MSHYSQRKILGLDQSFLKQPAGTIAISKN